VVAVDSCTNALFLALLYERMVGMRPPLEVPEGWSISYVDRLLKIPRRTYVGVMHAAINAGWRIEWIDEPWFDRYRMDPTRVVDCARFFAPDMYVPGNLMCLSFHAAKQLPLGRGGAILTDDEKAADWFRRARTDGRAPGDGEPYTTFPGHHMYLPPPTAALGLWILSRWVDGERTPERLPMDDYPDLSQLGAAT